MDKILTLNQVNNEVIQDQIKEIFFLSTSVKSFASNEHKNTFFMKWCGDYIQHYSDTFYLYLDSENKILGYLSGCNDSLDSLKVLKVPALNLFEEYFLQFPAHLHINFHPDARGMGLGSKLVEHYAQVLKEKKISGLHLVTSTDAKNVSFYRKLNFSFEIGKNFNSSELLFMGRMIE